MIPIEPDPEDGDITQAAVQALTEATRQDIDSGRSVVLVVNGELVRLDSSAGKTVLKKLPPRRKVSVRIKRASP